MPGFLTAFKVSPPDIGRALALAQGSMIGVGTVWIIRDSRHDALLVGRVMPLLPGSSPEAAEEWVLNNLLTDHAPPYRRILIGRGVLPERVGGLWPKGKPKLRVRQGE